MLPRLHEAVRRDPDNVGHYADCQSCKSTYSLETRRAMGCGWESPIAGAHAWAPESYTGQPLTVCPGYSTRLPEVVEVSEARFYLKNGSLGALIRGELTDSLRIGIRILENAEAETTNWSAKNR